MKTRQSFIRDFSLTGGVVLLVLVIGLFLLWRPQRAAMPPCPALPSGDEYVADYYGVGSVPHYLLRYGVFGVGKQLRAADVILMGSSHVEVGFSARQLSEDLSKANGRAVSVYNAGLPFGEGLPFEREIIRGQNLRNKTVVLDLFASSGLVASDYGTTALNANVLSAYVRIFQMWTTWLSDWLLDPVLPRFYPQDYAEVAHAGLPEVRRVHGIAYPRRFLLITGFRSWKTGDQTKSWHPSFGDLVSPLPPPMRLPYGSGLAGYDYLANAGIQSPSAEAALFRQNNLRMIYTLLPYEGYRAGVVPPDAQPYVPSSRRA